MNVSRMYLEKVIGQETVGGYALNIPNGVEGQSPPKCSILTLSFTLKSLKISQTQTLQCLYANFSAHCS